MMEYTANLSKAHDENNELENNKQIQAQMEALLESEGLGVLDAEALLPEGQEKAVYLGTPVSAGDSEGIDVKEVGDTPEVESETGQVPEDEDSAPDPLPESCPVLDTCDQALLTKIRELGGAATIAEISRTYGADMDRITGGDFAANGHAFYRAQGGHTLIALAGATDSDLTKAANRAEAEGIGESFERSVATAHEMKRDLMDRLYDLGGSASLDGAKRALAAAGHPRKALRAVLAERHERGWIRVSVKGSTGSVTAGERDTRARFLTLANAPEGSLASAAKRYAEDEREIPARRAEAAEKARKRGQDKAYPAPMVPFGGTRVTPAQQQRALYIEQAKAACYEAQYRGVQSITLKLAATDTLPAEEATLYTVEPDGAREFATARIKARILTGLSRCPKNVTLTGSRIVSGLFPEKAPQIIALLGEGRDLSPALAEPYNLFASAVNELISEGRVERSPKGLALAPEKAAEKASAVRAATTAGSEDSQDWADKAPRPERQSGPDAHGSDKYAADMAGAHDHRSIASGPQAPSTRPAQRKKTSDRIRSAIHKARTDQHKVQADTAKAECRQAWNEARAHYMAGLLPQDRLELYLQLQGEQRLERMLEAAEGPDGLYRAMLSLKDEDRITVRSSGGYTLIRASRELDREKLAEDLVEVMALEGVHVPEGTALAQRLTRVAAAREQLTQPAVA